MSVSNASQSFSLSLFHLIKSPFRLMCKDRNEYHNIQTINSHCIERNEILHGFQNLLPICLLGISIWIVDIGLRKGEWAVNYNSPQSFLITFSYSLAQQFLGFLLNFDLFVHLVECLKFKRLFVISEGVFFWIITRDVHKFFGHCLIPKIPVLEVSKLWILFCFTLSMFYLRI